MAPGCLTVTGTATLNDRSLISRATTLSLGNFVLTVNARHFGRIPGLSLQL
jgi:hypothetical protein